MLLSTIPAGNNCSWQYVIYTAIMIEIIPQESSTVCFKAFRFTGADPGFLERGFMCKGGGGGVTLLILSHFS